MSKFYRVCRQVAPSGGMGWIDDERYNVNAEAQAKVDELMAAREEVWEHDGMEFPIYFVQCYSNRGGMEFWEPDGMKDA